jgi:hypothetical protein
LFNNGIHFLGILSSAKWFAIALALLYNPTLIVMRKDERIGLRIPADLKKVLSKIAIKEGRSLAQVCEVFLRGGTEAYKRDGPKYLQRHLSRQKKEGLSD